MKSNNHYALILSGGSGSRLWPYSRENKPKQFLKFSSKFTLFQNTIIRVSKVFPDDHIYVVTNKDYYYETLGQLAEIDFSNVNIILEPEARNTLPAVALGVKKIHKINEKAIIGVFSSDHNIDSDDSFINTWNNSIKPVSSGNFVIFGIYANKPVSGYGYIEPGAPFDQTLDNQVFNVKNFIEKPSKKMAEEYLKNGFLWNSGMFVFSSNVFIDALSKYQSEIYDIIFLSDEDLYDVYSEVKNISIDYGLMELVKNICVVKSNMKWTDLGTWNSVHQFLLSKENFNKNNTIRHGNVISKNNNNSLLWTNDHLVAVYGVKDLIVIHDYDVTLICNKDNSDELKNLIELLHNSPNKKYLENHPVVNRPWGKYTVLYEGETFKIKSIVVHPGHKLSLQRHQYRNEHWVIINGKAKVTKNDDIFYLETNESTFIKAGDIHRLENDTNHYLELIEVSIGSLISEDDIERFGDDYGRS